MPYQPYRVTIHLVSDHHPDVLYEITEELDKMKLKIEQARIEEIKDTDLEVFHVTPVDDRRLHLEDRETIRETLHKVLLKHGVKGEIQVKFDTTSSAPLSTQDLGPGHLWPFQPGRNERLSGAFLKAVMDASKHRCFSICLTSAAINVTKVTIVNSPTPLTPL